ncbi:MAG: Citrate lyase [Cenarchaeum symbiont of Oopsacas minuta]|nr:Citrate lyase [Cenarchaeum symbiont of Oopsacas minuta]
MPNITRLIRSLTFVPSNNKRFLIKACTLQTDVVCLDLEDSIPNDQKSKARCMAAQSLAESHMGRVFVRTNSPDSKTIPQDIEEVLRPGLAGLVIPKVDSAQQLEDIISLLDKLESRLKLPKTALIPSIESALGAVNCYQIASCSERIEAVVFGVFDLLADLYTEYEPNSPAAAYARAKIPLEARAARVPAIDAIWQDTKDEAGLERDSLVARSLGYAGKCVIHPDQLPIIHKIFKPTKAEIEWANKVCQAYERSVQESGRGAVTIDGKMVDEVHYKYASKLLETI